MNPISPQLVTMYTQGDSGKKLVIWKGKVLIRIQMSLLKLTNHSVKKNTKVTGN